MPKGPNGQKRPGEVIGAAIMVAKIATGEVEDNATPAGLSAHHPRSRLQTQKFVVFSLGAGSAAPTAF